MSFIVIATWSMNNLSGVDLSATTDGVAQDAPVASLMF